jgi:hypothetical protein
MKLCTSNFDCNVLKYRIKIVCNTLIFRVKDKIIAIQYKLQKISEKEVQSQDFCPLGLRRAFKSPHINWDKYTASQSD